MSNYKHSYYLEDLIRTDKLKKTLKKAVLALKHRKFDAIAFSGYSGALLAAPLSYVLDVPMILVRKDTDNCHSSFLVEGFSAATKYVIVDDCVASGETVWHIINSIKAFAPKAKCIGVLATNEFPSSYTELKADYDSVFCKWPLVNPDEYTYGKRKVEEKVKAAKAGKND